MKRKKRPLKAGQTRITKGKKVAVKTIAGNGNRKDKAIVQTKKYRYRDRNGNWRVRSIQTITKTKKYGKQKPKI